MTARARPRPFARASLVGPAAALALAAHADEYPPAPYVPTVEEDVELMLDVADAGAGDYLIDLGSGDGRIVIAAAGRGALGHGVEIDPELVELARRNAREAGVADRVAFVEGDLFDADISAASVVTLYLFPEINLALRPKLLAELEPGTRVVSNSFDLGDWRADVHDRSARSSGGILMWIVPARIDGAWSIVIDGDGDGDGDARSDIEGDIQGGGAAAPAQAEAEAEAPAEAQAEAPAEAPAYTLHVEQRYQDIDARLEPAGGDDAAAPAPDTLFASLRGDRVAIVAVAERRTYAFAGRVDGDEIVGYVQISAAPADADSAVGAADRAELARRAERLRRWRATR